MCLSAWPYLPSLRSSMMDELASTNACVVNTNEAFLSRPTGFPSYRTHIKNAFIVLCAINVITSVIATFTNTVVMTAIWKTPSLHEPSSVMLFFLAVTDLCVGLILQPCYVTYLVSVLVQDHNIYDVMFLVKKRLSSLLSMSVMTVAAVSIERYLALALHLRYDALVTSHRGIVACLSIWVAPTTFTVMSLWYAQKPWFRITASFGGFVLALSSLIALPIIQW